MSLKSSLFAFAAVATLLAGPVAPAHAITGTVNQQLIQQRAAKAQEPRLAVECALRPYHIWIYNPDPSRLGHCESHKPADPPPPNWGNAGDRTWCGFSCGAFYGS